jgi:hypothetical protein
MGKASSAKKVARAARAGSSKRTNRPRLSFPLAIIAVIVLGTGTVVYARSTHEDMATAEGKPSSTAGDHWHAAYGFYTCDKFEPNLQDIPDKEDTLGIHTHGDGVMHIHPFKPAASGDKARMKVWAEMVGVKFSKDGWKLPNGQEYKSGSATCGDKPARVAVYKWNLKDARAPVQVFESGFGDIPFTEDRDAFTFAVVPQDSTEPGPKPESIPQLDQLEDVDPSAGGAGGATGLPPGVDLGNLTGGGGAPPAGAPAGGETPPANSAP